MRPMNNWSLVFAGGGEVLEGLHLSGDQASYLWM